VAVAVVGPSMVPTLRPGDAVLVRLGGRARAGDVVLAAFADLPDRLVVKRALRPAAGGWYVRSDNPYARGDSATHGPARVVGRVVLRYWPRPQLLRAASPVPDSAADGRSRDGLRAADEEAP